ncbi:MAG: DUF3796 domain-containing protein [Tissierellia bacterium]|nr:DUF3796 domain-containing protein [Tissierellia bacterium]
MKINRFLYGSIGFLSLIGILGLFTNQKGYIAFFAFAIHFKYFTIRPDEMMEEYMNKSTRISFSLGSIVMTICTLFYFFNHFEPHKAMVFGLACGWASAMLSYSIMIIYYEFREMIGMKND